MSANEKAEVVIVVIKKMLRWIAVGITAIFSIGLIIYGYFSFDNWYSFERHKEKVYIAVSFDETVCTKDFPLVIKITNNSSKTISKVSIDVDVTRTGYSRNINGYQYLDSDKIIKPREDWQSCWRVESKEGTFLKPIYLDGKNMTVKVSYYNPTFED